MRALIVACSYVFTTRQPRPRSRAAQRALRVATAAKRQAAWAACTAATLAPIVLAPR